MVAQHAMDPALPGLAEVIERLRKATVEAQASGSYEQEIRRASSRALVERLIWLGGGAPMPQVRAIASEALAKIQNGQGLASGEAEDAAAQHLMAADIKRFLERPAAPITSPTTFDAPPGAPIGETGMEWLSSPSWCTWKDGGN
jgi:hypothetical protein